MDQENTMATRYEREIPEGYEARIEGNKVIIELKESEDERVRKHIIEVFKERVGYVWKDGTTNDECLAYLGKQKEQKPVISDEAIREGVAHFGITQYQIDYWLKKHINVVEQQPAESDAIKGGDFISDGKRVFLVLANVKERNLGETGSTFCEGLILGVDGVVYCNGDDFKKFKRATSDERAKFIHVLKVGVELNEQPADWSEDIIRKAIKEVGLTQHQIDWFKTNVFPPKQEWSEEDEDELNNILAFVKNDIPISGDTRREFYNWLKSIKNRGNSPKSNTNSSYWKPSEEQVSILGKVFAGCKLNTSERDSMVDLFYHLKDMI